MNQLFLHELPVNDSVSLLQRFQPDLSRNEAEAIASELGHLPLALHLAGSFLHTYRHTISPAAYLAELQSHHQETLLQHPSLQGLGTEQSPTRHTLHLARTFAISYQKLETGETRDHLARLVLARAACFAPGEPIPRGLLVGTMAGVTANRLEIEDALGRLAALGLVGEGELGTIRLHSLLAAFVQQTGAEPEAHVQVEQTLLERAQYLNNERALTVLQMWQNHLRYVANNACYREDKRAAALCHELGRYLQYSGAYDEAKEYIHLAFALREKLFGVYHQESVASLHHLGVLAHIRGRYEEACQHWQRVYRIRQNMLGEEHPDTAKSLNILGILFSDMGSYVEAQKAYKQALAIQEKVLPTAHLGIAQTLNNLAGLLMNMGAYAEALTHLERALAIKEATLGLEHPSTAVTMNNLGYALYLLQRYEQAEPILQQSELIRTRLLGEDHPDVAQSLDSLGALYLATHQMENAYDCLSRALQIRQSTLGRNNPQTAETLVKLGLWYQRQGQQKLARKAWQQALEMQEKSLGAQHPDTQATHHYLQTMSPAVILQ